MVKANLYITSQAAHIYISRIQIEIMIFFLISIVKSTFSIVII